MLFPSAQRGPRRDHDEVSVAPSVSSSLYPSMASSFAPSVSSALPLPAQSALVHPLSEVAHAPHEKLFRLPSLDEFREYVQALKEQFHLSVGTSTSFNRTSTRVENLSIFVLSSYDTVLTQLDRIEKLCVFEDSQAFEASEKVRSASPQRVSPSRSASQSRVALQRDKENEEDPFKMSLHGKRAPLSPANALAAPRKPAQSHYLSATAATTAATVKKRVATHHAPEPHREREKPKFNTKVFGSPLDAPLGTGRFQPSSSSGLYDRLAKAEAAREKEKAREKERERRSASAPPPKSRRLAARPGEAKAPLTPPPTQRVRGDRERQLKQIATSLAHTQSLLASPALSQSAAHRTPRAARDSTVAPAPARLSKQHTPKSMNGAAGIRRNSLSSSTSAKLPPSSPSSATKAPAVVAAVPTAEEVSLQSEVDCPQKDSLAALPRTQQIFDHGAGSANDDAQPVALSEPRQIDASESESDAALPTAESPQTERCAGPASESQQLTTREDTPAEVASPPQSPSAALGDPALALSMVGRVRTLRQSFEDRQLPKPSLGAPSTTHNLARAQSSLGGRQQAPPIEQDSTPPSARGQPSPQHSSPTTQKDTTSYYKRSPTQQVARSSAANSSSPTKEDEVY